LQDTGWHHVACVFDPINSREELYLDGVSKASGNVNDPFQWFGVSNVGTLIGKHGNLASSFDYVGKIDDARVYNRALSASEVKQLYLIGK
jgi:hypothetical protein